MPQRTTAAERLDALDPVVARLVAGDFFFQMSFQAVYFVGIIGCATYSLGADAFVVSMLTFSMNVSLLAASGAAGVLVDRIGPRRTALLSMAACSAAGLLAWLAPLSVGSLEAFGVALGAAFGVGSTALDAYPRHLAEDLTSLKYANSLMSTASSASIIAGPALGGAIASVLPTQCVFAIAAIAPVPAALLVAGCRERMGVAALVGAAAGERAAGDAVGDVARPAGFWGELREGLGITFGHPDLRLLFLVGFMGFFAYGAFDSLESLYYRDVLHVSVEWMGWLNVIVGVGCTLGSLAVLRIPTRRLGMGLLCALLLLTGLGSMLYVGTPLVACAAAGQFLAGLGFGSMGPVRTSLVQSRCDVSHVGRVTSVIRIGLNGAGTLPLVVAPFLARALGVQAVLFAASTFCAAIAVVFWVAVRRLDGRPR